jgi:transcriptional regulator with XRE-family HTH domain
MMGVAESKTALGIARLRQELGWKRADLARELGVTYKTVEHWELGRNEIGMKILSRIRRIIEDNDLDLEIKPGEKVKITCPDCGRTREVMKYSVRKLASGRCRSCSVRQDHERRQQGFSDLLAPCGKVIVPAKEGERCPEYFSCKDECQSQCLSMLFHTEWEGFTVKEAS